MLLIVSYSFSIIFCVLISEIILRIWKPQFLKLRGNTILFQRDTTVENNYNFNSEKIKSQIIIKKNSLSFRGPDKSIDFSEKTTLIAVGGSTMGCLFITEGKT